MSQAHLIQQGILYFSSELGYQFFSASGIFRVVHLRG